MPNSQSIKYWRIKLKNKSIKKLPKKTTRVNMSNMQPES
jgi:hypothetical protein